MEDLALIPQASLAVRSKVARRCRCVFATLAVRQSRLGQSAKLAASSPLTASAPPPTARGCGRPAAGSTRGVDADNPGVQIIHRGRYKSLTDEEKRLLKRRQAIEPLIGHTKADHRMDRCWLQGAVGDALHALCCAAGYNIRWLLRAITRLGLQGLFCALSAVVMCVVALLGALLTPPKTPGATARTAPIRLSAVTSLRLDAAV